MIKFDENFLTRYHRKHDTGTPVIYFLVSDGAVFWQGHIDTLSLDGKGVAIIYDLLAGQRYCDVAFTKKFLKECIFFESEEEMQGYEGGMKK